MGRFGICFWALLMAAIVFGSYARAAYTGGGDSGYKQYGGD